MKGSFAQVNEKIYLEAKGIMNGFDDFILNDFIRTDGKVNRMFRLLAERAFSYYCDETFRISEEAFSFVYRKIAEDDLEKLKHGEELASQKLKALVRIVLTQKLKNVGFYTYISADMSRFALASKEAFCDLNMIKLFGMGVADYLYTFYKLLFGKYKNLDSNIFNVDDMEVGWLERRLGLIIDVFHGGINASESYQKFSEEIRESALEYDDILFRQFIEYCIKCYSVYLKSNRMIRKKYLQLLDSTIIYWEKQMT